MLLKAWTHEESFTYEGEYVQIPTPVTVFPKPLQKPHPPLWLAGTSAESMQLAARMDMLPLSSSMMGMAGVRAQFGALVRAHTDLGEAYPQPPLDVSMCHTLPHR